MKFINDFWKGCPFRDFFTCLDSLSDTGPGIPKDQLEAVFEKYKRLKAGEGEAGFGLGLAISRKIVELHGGKIRAESGVTMPSATSAATASGLRVSGSP